MSGNDLDLQHCVSVLMKELHAFAQATGAPAGANIFRWAEQKSDEVSHVARNSTQQEPV